MIQTLQQITLVDTRTLLYFILVISLLHELEEWNILKWYQKVNTNVPNVSHLHVRITLIFVVIMNFIWTVISLIPKSEIVMAYIIMLLIAVGVMNGLQHFFWLMKFRRYAPGETSEKLKSCCHCEVLYTEAPKACRKAGQSHFYLKSEDEIASLHFQ